MRVLTAARHLLAVAALLAGAAELGAQTTTGVIRGRVTDPAGNPVAAATIVAVNEQTGFTNGAQSDDEGAYSVRLLPPGTYRLTARRLGTQPVQVEGVRVTVGSASLQNFTLAPVNVELEAVQVTAERPVDVTEAGVTQTVTTEQIEKLPALGRDFTDFIALSGLVSPTPEATTGGQFSIAGQRPSQTNIQIDGVDANNAFFGENRGGSRIPFNFSLESVREFQVVTNGYDVEYGNYSGGVINIVTKGGTNEFKGSVYANYRGDQLTADDFEGNAPKNYEVQQYAAQVSGPVVKDRLFFLFSLDGQRRREPFRPINPASVRAEADPSDPADVAEAEEYAAALESFYEILETRYGVENAAAGYNEYATTNDVLTLFGRVDWNINRDHRLTLRHNFSDYDNLNEAGTSAFYFQGGRSKAEAYRNTTNSLVGELNSSLGGGRFNVFRFQYSTEDRPRVGNELRPEIKVNRLHSGGGVAYYGGNSVSFRNSLEESKLQLVDNFTWQLGDHTLKLGTNNIFARVDNIFWNRGSGIYEFADLAALAAGTPTKYTRDVRADGGLPRSTFDVQEYSVYAQDEWQATPKLLVGFGLRYDVARYGDRPGRVIDVERAFGLETGIAPIDDDNVSPRLSIAYDVNGDGRQVLRGGAALFYGRVPYVLGGNVAATEVPMLSLVCEGNASEGDPDAPPRVIAPGGGYAGWNPNGADNPMNCAGAGGVGGVPVYSFWSPGFEMPETIKANLGYERLLGDRTKMTLDFVYTASNKLYTIRNINLRDPQFALASEGGRRVFVPEGSFNPSSAGTSARLRNTDFGDIYVNYNDGVARSQAASVALDHHLTDDVSLQASYTWTKAYDNSSFSCCTSSSGFSDRRVGAMGPNEAGGIKHWDAGWGPSDFVRNHTFVLSGTAELPWDITVSTIWRLQSGTPWSPEQSGDLNGDGVTFNDRPYIYRPEELPVAAGSRPSGMTETEFVQQQRDLYARKLAANECVAEYVGQIIPRNTCRQPWFNRLDVGIKKRFPTVNSQSAELSVDLFNVLNGLNSKWGRYRSVSAARRNLLEPRSYDAETGQILYTVPQSFGNKTALGSNLLLQFSAQVGMRYYF